MAGKAVQQRDVPYDWPRLANFRILKVLGKGSYGKVYKVQRGADEQFYALKEVDLVPMHPDDRQSAVNEIRMLCAFNHPNIARYHEAFVQGTKLYIVLEYAPFGDLKYYIEKAARQRIPFPEECVWRIFLQLAQGLAAIHARQIVHRDIKPANIFMCANDLLKIGDLGVAKALTQMNFTRTMAGTPLYMSPEVWSSRPYSYGSDMWSLGCVLYEMMVLLPPFRGRNEVELRQRVSMGRYEPIRAGTYSPELIAFCHSLLAVDPRKRPTAEQILASPHAARWMRVVPTPRRASESGGPANGIARHLLDTIMVPRDLRQLPQVLPRVLPPANYDSDSEPCSIPSPTPVPAAPIPGGRPSNNGAAAGLPPRQQQACKPPSPRPVVQVAAAPRAPSPVGPSPRSASPVHAAGLPSGGARLPAYPGGPLLANRPPMPGNVDRRRSDNGAYGGFARPPSREPSGGLLLPAVPGASPRVSEAGCGAGLAGLAPANAVLQPMGARAQRRVATAD